MKFVIDPAEIQKLTPMPASVSKLAQLVSDPDSDLHEVARVIEFDQALTTNVMRWANSAWSGAQSPIKTMREAVIRLGTAQLLKLAVGFKVADAMQNVDIKYPGVEKKMWQHSVMAALTIEHIPQFVNRKVPQVAFTAALIHDIGKLLLYRHLRPEFINELGRLLQEGVDPIKAEEEVLGTNHAIVGGEIAWYWQFPDELVHAIEKHHEFDPEDEPLINAVQIANTIANVQGEVKSEHLKINPEVYHRMGMDLSKVEFLHAIVLDKLEETISLWNSG